MKFFMVKRIPQKTPQDIKRQPLCFGLAIGPVTPWKCLVLRVFSWVKGESATRCSDSQQTASIM
jgi:hypothetical protein